MKSYILGLKNVRQALLLANLFLMVGLLSVPLAQANIGDRLEVTKANAILHAGPSSSAARLVRVGVGEQMVEMERQGSWVFVSLKSSGDQGWMSTSVVRKAARKAAKSKVKKKAKRKTSAKKSIKKASRSNVTLQKLAEAPVPVLNSPYKSRQTTLKDIGLSKGILFEGARGAHSRTFYFPAPLDSLITHGSFRLMFRATPNLLDLANIRVAINDIPYKQINLPQDGAMHAMDVRLPSSVFKGSLVKVTISTILPVSDNRCFDGRLTNIFLHVFPESSLSISYQPVERSIRDAWRLLPQHVTISLSAGQLSKAQFASTLALMAMLVDDGKKVNITRLPDIGDIIIAPKATVQALMHQNGVDANANPSLKHVSNLVLLRVAGKTAIALLDPYDVQPMYLLEDTWQMLGAGDHYRVFRPDNMHSRIKLMGTEGESGYFSLPLSEFGMDVSTKAITSEVAWQTVINPFALPMGTQPDLLNLNIVAPVRWDEDPTYELYVFLNDVLVKSARLNNDGLKQRFTINLPSEYQKQFNDIRIVVQHDIVEGNCKGVMPHDYIQVTPDSALVVKESTIDTPKKFADLSKYFLPGFDTYVESSYLDRPEQILQLMARLAADFPLIIDHSRLHFVPAGNALQPEGPFVAVGRFALGDDVDAPVRFDRGRVKITSPNGESYFDVDQLSKITIAQIARASSAYGLWVTPSSANDLSNLERLDLSEDNVAFIDSQGVAKTLDSSEPTLAQVYYPDVEDWFAVLGKYKFWLMVVLWFLLTLIVVYLYRMSRINKLAREEDDAMYQTDEDRTQGTQAAHMHEDHTHHPGGELDHLDEKR